MHRPGIRNVGVAVPSTDPVELRLDRTLVRVTALSGLMCLAVAALVGSLAAGRAGAVGATYGAGAVGLNATAAAWISAQGGTTSRGIGIGRVVAALPIRLVVLAGALVLGISVLGLPATPVALAVCSAEGVLMVVQSWLVLRGPTFIGPLNERRT